MNDKYTSEEVRLEAERCGSGADSCDYDPVKNGMLTAYAERIEADERDLECAQRIPEPIPMLLFCPKCHTQHIDKPETAMQRYHAADLGKPLTIWDNPPHRSHLCHSCGCIWRPADVPTTGVARIETRGKSDNYDGSAKPPASPKSLERAAGVETMTPTQNVEDALKLMDGCISTLPDGNKRDWQTIRVHLLGQDAEIERLRGLVAEAPTYFHPDYDWGGDKLEWLRRAGLAG